MRLPPSTSPVPPSPPPPLPARPTSWQRARGSSALPPRRTPTSTASAKKVRRPPVPAALPCTALPPARPCRPQPPHTSSAPGAKRAQELKSSEATQQLGQKVRLRVHSAAPKPQPSPPLTLTPAADARRPFSHPQPPKVASQTEFVKRFGKSFMDNIKQVRATKATKGGRAVMCAPLRRLPTHAPLAL